MKGGTFVFDSNIWISFILNKKFHKLINIIIDNNLKVFISDEMLYEIENVLKRPKFSKYINDNEINEAIIIISKVSVIFNDYKTVRLTRDIKDDYIIVLAKATKTKFVVTGDKDLLEYKHTPSPSIINLSQFMIGI